MDGLYEPNEVVNLSAKALISEPKGEALKCKILIISFSLCYQFFLKTSFILSMQIQLFKECQSLLYLKRFNKDSGAYSFWPVRLSVCLSEKL